MRTGAILLTPTQRSAQLWRDKLLQADPTLRPTVLPWGAWTAQLWQGALLRGDEDRVLLNPMQNAELWADVLRNSELQTLRPLRSLVDLCVQAQHLLHTHGAADASLHFKGSAGSDAAQFESWFRAYSHQCRQQRLLPPAALDDALGSLPGNMVTTPLVLLGFDDLPPSRQRLLERAAAESVVVTSLNAADVLQVQVNRATVLRCSDEYAEWLNLGTFLRDALAQNRRNIVVVLPDTDACRPALERQLRQSLSTSQDATVELSWEFSEGRALRSLPIAADALALLRWALGPASVASVGLLLQSPYLDFGVGVEAAAELEVRILRAPAQVCPEWTMQSLANQCEPDTRRVLHAVATASQQLRGVRTPGAWAQSMAEVLQAAGWPGPRGLSSIEYQALERWNDLLDGMASLDIFERSMPFTEFLGMLDDGAAQLRFAPENRGAPIQILSPDEARGVTADTLWFAHADETRWNGKRSASPLLPWALQVEFGMPGTDPAQDGEAHRRITDRLLRSAREITVSYAASNKAGEARHAAVLRLFPNLERAEGTAYADRQDQLMLDEFRDDTGPAFASDAPVPGGVAVLQSQAACAFRAFAERRLYSTEPDFVDLGYDARDRGNLLHKVLELFWQRTGTQAELLRLHAAGELKAAVQADIDAVLQVNTRHAWSAAYLEVQRRRLRQVLLHWLHFEAQRPAFRVSDTERKAEAQLGSLHFDVRVDRIDMVDHNGETSTVLIDYKTGTPSASGWMGTRPEEPQLPFYAVAAGLDNVQAIAFAAVKPGETKLGMQSFPPATPLLLAGKSKEHTESFDQQMEEWWGTLVRLSNDFAGGDARVDPREYPGTCKHCRQRMLCRLDPDSLEVGEDDLEEDVG